MELERITEKNILSLSKWMRFVGVINLIMGIIMCIPVVYAIFGWILILTGLWTIKASNSFKNFLLNHDLISFNTAIEKLKNIYILTGIITIISLILFFFVIVGVIVMISLGLFHPPMPFNRIFN